MLLRHYFMILVLLVSTPALAVRLTVQNPCSDELWLESESTTAVGQSLGEYSVQALEQARMPFVGHVGGISSIKGTPTSDASLELISDEEMKAYGWCYTLDGQRLELMSDQVKIERADSHVAWFFGYAHYLRGEWLSMCTPTAPEAPAFICGPGPSVQ